ncbi:SDR family oxidoreductase [bacterium]|nr:SDR family oxidoreductase [bacterium]
METKFFFESKTAIVSGGGSGIGKAIAKGLFDSGANVFILDIDRDRCAAAVREIGGETGGRVKASFCDIRDAASVAEAVDTAIADFGIPDFLVNSVAVTKRKPALELSEEEIDTILSTNFSGVFRLCRHVAARMMEQSKRCGGRRKILNIASTGAMQGSKNFSAYNASKAALVTLTKVLANEWCSAGINVNALCPGPTNTPFVSGYYDEHPEIVAGIISRTPAGRIAQPEDFAGPALFLLSSSSDWIVGEAIVCDGGKNLNG